MYNPMKKRNKKRLIIVAAVVILAIASLILLFPSQYNDGLEQEGIDAAEPFPNLQFYRKYLDADAPIENYILLADNIAVGTAGERCDDADAYINFEIEEILKGDVTDKTIRLMDMPGMGFTFRENDKYLVFLSGNAPTEYACFNITGKTATACLKEGAFLFRTLPRNSEKLVKYIREHQHIDTYYINTRAGLNASYPPEVILERANFRYECEITDVKFAFTDSLQEKIYTIYAKSLTPNDNFDMIAVEQVLSKEEAKSLKGKRCMGYFARFGNSSSPIVGFLDLYNYVDSKIMP